MTEGRVDKDLLETAKTGNLRELQMQLADFHFDPVDPDKSYTRHLEHPQEATWLICAAAEGRQAETIQ
ncbi:hypothetical protein ANO11243_066200 [Dothideomycetidae sp. 11243]|nr:hypothetical protein ANO11243_066200 [fungal sp. No.11243]